MFLPKISFNTFFAPSFVSTLSSVLLIVVDKYFSLNKLVGALKVLLALKNLIENLSLLIINSVPFSISLVIVP